MRKLIELSTALLVIFLAPVRGDLARAAEGAVTLTPDGMSFLVSKDVGVERWTVSLNVSPSDRNVVVNVTGNVFKSDGGPPSFVVCRPRDDSSGTLTDPASIFRFTCNGADACPTNASECARTSWRLISDDLSIPAQVFLPSGGLTRVAALPAGLRSMAAQGFVDRLLLDTADLRFWARLLGRPWEKVASWVTSSANAQTDDRGATLSLDGLSFLVNKDISQQRWSIGLNYLPVRTDDGGMVNRLEAITGNVLRGTGTPTFVYCSIRDDSTGTLDDMASTFRLSCLGADGCSTTAEECSQSSWTLISDDVSIPASVFLPPGGLPGVQSDPELLVMGSTSHEPSYQTPDYTTQAGRSSASAACAVGQVCLATRIGSCTQVSGHLVDGELGCICQVDAIDPSCITCGSGASGQCGGDCEFPVGNFTARGMCLPVSSDRPDCICFGIDAGQSLVVGRCGGPLGASCQGDRCCTDDPMDGCEPDGSAACPGICVAASGNGDGSGSCFPTGSTPTPEPTVDPTPSGKPTPHKTASPPPSVTPTVDPTPSPRPSAAPTANPTPSATASPKPSVAPTAKPTPSATASPKPTPESTSTPLASPTATSSPTPTARPTSTPTPSPSPEPMATPSPGPSCGDGHLDPHEQCEPTLNNCGANHCSSVTCQCFTCTPQTLRGDNGLDSVVTYDLGTSVGDFGFQYSAFTADADEFIVSYEGQVLYDTGCDVGGVPDPFILSLPGGTSTKIQVQVDGSCKGGNSGSWQYTVGCPG